jgi:flagellar assembly protein FliH
MKMPLSSNIIKRHDVKEDEETFILNTKAEEKEEVSIDVSGEITVILEQARAEAEDIKKNAFNEGYDNGYEKGFAAGSMEGQYRAEETYKKALEVLVETEKYRMERLNGLQKEILDLAVAISEKIIFAELTLNDQIVGQIAGNAIKKLVVPEYIIIHAHPKEAEVLIQQKDMLSKQVIGDVPIRIVKEHDLPAGSCFIETEKGFLDASIDTQVSELKKYWKLLKNRM